MHYAKSLVLTTIRRQALLFFFFCFFTKKEIGQGGNIPKVTHPQGVELKPEPELLTLRTHDSPYEDNAT